MDDGSGGVAGQPHSGGHSTGDGSADGSVRVVVVDDHQMLLDAMTIALSRHPRIEVVGSANSFSDAVDLLARADVDVLVTDLQLRDGRGTDLVDHATRSSPSIPVLLITGTDGRRAVQAALASGCAGFVSKAHGFERLVDAVLAVARGAAVFPAALLSATFDAGPTDASGLSTREVEVLQLLAGARSVTEIADELHLSLHTVRNHVKQILAKLGAHSQLEAVVIGARHGLVEIG
jgi:DNA-binding NarL/FixJ family response regulator